MKYSLFGTIKVNEDSKSELIEVLNEAVKILESNDNCIQYLVCESKAKDEVYVWEAWTSKQAHDDSLKDMQLLSLIVQAKPLIKEMPSGTELSIVGGKGIQ